MNEQEVSLAVVQHIIVIFLNDENVKSAETLTRLGTQLDDEML